MRAVERRAALPAVAEEALRRGKEGVAERERDQYEHGSAADAREYERAAKLRDEERALREEYNRRRDEWVRTLHQWFDHWLKGLPNGVMLQPRASIETTPGVWRQQADWPALGTVTRTVGLGANGTLGGRPSPGIRAAFISAARNGTPRATLSSTPLI